MKRRSCGEVDNEQTNQFTQRKMSHQVSEIKSKEILKHYNSAKTTRRNPKDEIISFIGKYIKQQTNGTQKSQGQMANEMKEYNETLQNLKDFLQYLEDKKIINTKNLENNKEEMSNLI